MIRVLLADDQPLVRAGLRTILGEEVDIEVCGEAGDGAEAEALAAELQPDVVLMDVRMPNVNGLEATRKIMAAEPAPRVVILTTFDLDEYVFEALKLGACGFLLKDTGADELVRAVRVAARGEALLAPSVTMRLIARFVPDGGGRPAPAALKTLTEREREVLVLVAKGLSNAEIATRLFLGETTVKTHVAHVLDKLGLRDRVQAVVLAYESRLIAPGID
ncbi:MAG TPA: response regulator transcription factor [Gemmatimonadales bacterium]|nr:response regulator transcription factor [Gemmatimonadales bacterium]